MNMACRTGAAVFILLVAYTSIPTVLSATFGERLIEEQLTIDANWIDKDAQGVVDIVFVLDTSGSVSDKQFKEELVFMRNFLEYFSISRADAQVGVVTFESTAEVRQQLKQDYNKCDLLDDLVKLRRTSRGGTNIKAGLDLARQLIAQNGRRNTGARPIIVLITDGVSGGDTASAVQALKNMKSLVILITIGNIGNHNEMYSWASRDNRNKEMAFAVENFDRFAHIANYIHGGTHQSRKYSTALPNRLCGNKCTGSAICTCDSLYGRRECACGHGSYVRRYGSRDRCDPCPIGTYQEEALTIARRCKHCPNNLTTKVAGSDGKGQCICGTGFWNKANKSKFPPCSPIRCPQETPAQLDSHSISLNGSCQYTYGQTCHYKCHDGHLTSGITALVCGADGRMNYPLPQCQELLCPKLASIPNSDGWKCVKSNKVTTDFSYGTQCTNKCNLGYIPRRGTSSFIRCGLDESRDKGKWGGTTLVCETETCQALPDILNGQYTQPECSRLSTDIVFGKVCAVQCNHGYKVTEDIKWTCQSNGQWSNYGRTAFCLDVKSPEFLTCPQHITLDNEESEGYALVKLQPLEAFDNDASGTIKQTMTLTLEGESEGTEYPCDNKVCGYEYFKFPIGSSTVNFTATDRAGNSDSCIFTVTAKDIEDPEVVECEGPVKDEKGFIFSDQDEAFINWTIPTFRDNSGGEIKIYSTGSPGMYRVGRSWTMTYTAKDKAGNEAVCEFTFKLSGVRCPELHRPANGALVCDKLAFGVYCAPQCEKGLKRLVPDHIRRAPNDYACSLEGKWIPHDIVGDCALRVPVDEDTLDTFMFTWYDGNCNDEQTQQQIIQNTIDALESGANGVLGSIFAKSQNVTLTSDHFDVFCGAKNESIVQIGAVERRRRDVDMLPQTIGSIEAGLDQN